MTRRIDIPYERLVREMDPDWQRDKHREVEYEFSRRSFTADRTRRGAYRSTTASFDEDYAAWLAEWRAQNGFST